MTKKEKRRYGYMERFLLLTLLEGKLTQVEAYRKLRSLLFHFGVWQRLKSERVVSQFEKVDQAFEHLQKKGVVAETKGVYRLTEKGRTDAEELHRGVIKFALKVDDFLSNGETASKFSAFVNALFSALKLVVGFLSNSMALIADGMDNLIDTFSSVTTFFGIKYKKEIYSTAIVLVLMFFTSITLGYQALSRFIHPEAIEVGFLPIFVAVFSGIIFSLLSVYQHFVGKRYESLTLISQSIDSRNHAIVAAAVLIGFICAGFGVMIIDSVVSLVVAILILWSAIELSLEAFRAARGVEVDFSKFKKGYEAKLDKYKWNYFRTWTLSELRDFKSKEDLVSEFKRAFALAGVPLVHEFDLSLSRGFDYESNVDAFLNELAAEGSAMEHQGKFIITRSGEREMNKQSMPKRHRLVGLMKGNRFELKVDSKLKNLPVISDFVSDAMKQLGADLESIFKVQMAVDEACTNIIEHGYLKEGEGSINIICRKPRDDLIVTIKDKGRPFDPNFFSSASYEFDEQKLSGLGIYIIKGLMNEVSYHPDEKGNELTMVKHLTQTGG